MSNTPKRIGLMGCGVVADYGHIPAILNTPGLVLHAVFDPNQATLARVQEKYGIPQAYSTTEAFFASGIEAVSITSPATFHKANVLDCALHGLPVLCEKPLALNSNEATEMIAAMATANAPLYSAFCYRFSPCALKIRELVRAKAIGEVRALRLIYNWNLHGKYTTDSSGNRIIQKRRENRMLESGPMLDCGTHQIDLAQFWLGSPVIDFSSEGAWVENYAYPDHIWLHMNHANGAHTVVEISYSFHQVSKHPKPEFVYELIGTEGVIRYDREAQSFCMDTAEGTTEFPFHEEKSFAGLYAEWAQALHSGHSDLLTTAQDGMRVIEIASQSTETAREQRTCPAL